MRNGHVVSVSAYLWVDKVDCEDDEDEKAIGLWSVVVLSGAVAPGSTVSVSFVAWAAADVVMLQERSKKSVHLRSGAPIVGIARLHSSTKPCLLQVDLASVEYSCRYHGQPQVNRRYKWSVSVR